jgi:hypothetical protein
VGVLVRDIQVAQITVLLVVQEAVLLDKIAFNMQAVLALQDKVLLVEIMLLVQLMVLVEAVVLVRLGLMEVHLYLAQVVLVLLILFLVQLLHTLAVVAAGTH